MIKAKLDEGSPISLHVLLVQGVIAAEVVYSYKWLPKNGTQRGIHGIRWLQK